jgi:hypothetical protein
VVVTLMMAEDGIAAEKMETAKTFLTDKALSLSISHFLNGPSNPTPTVTYSSTVSQQHCKKLSPFSFPTSPPLFSVFNGCLILEILHKKIMGRC